MNSRIPGYDYGKSVVPHSPVALEELRELEQSVGWTEDDTDVMRAHADLFDRHAEAMVDTWRSVIGSHPHLAKWFFGPDGKPDEEYKARVKQRFVQWVRDACTRPRDQQWLDYQEEIGRRHTPEKKNATDDAHTATHVPLRHVYAFSAVVVVTTRQFFVDAGITGRELERLSAAWLKTVLVHVTLWSRPYCKEGLW